MANMRDEIMKSTATADVNLLKKVAAPRPPKTV
jgi:hypothetical protein